MNRLSGRQLMLIGFVLLLIGVLLPFAMVIHLVESTLELDYASFLASLVGLIIGLTGVAYTATGRK